MAHRFWFWVKQRIYLYILDWHGQQDLTEGRRTGLSRVFGLQSRFAFGVGSGRFWFSQNRL